MVCLVDLVHQRNQINETNQINPPIASFVSRLIIKEHCLKGKAVYEGVFFPACHCLMLSG